MCLVTICHCLSYLVTSPYHLQSPMSVKPSKNGSGMEINGINIDHLMMISPAKVRACMQRFDYGGGGGRPLQRA